MGEQCEMERELLIYSRVVRWDSLRGRTCPTPALAGPVTTNGWTCAVAAGSWVFI